MKKKTLVLHIGMGKTGSTAIQNCLALNRELLRQEDIAYPVWQNPQKRNNHNGIAQCLSSEQHRHYLEPFLADLHTDKASTLIISGETLFVYPERYAFARPLRTKLGGSVFARNYTPPPADVWIPRKRALIEELRRLLPKAEEYRIIVFLRRQDLWLESVYNEDIKGGHVWCRFDEFEKYYFNTLHYKEQLSIWEEVFGGESLVVRVYEKSQLPGGVVPEFLEAARLDHLADRLEKPEDGYPNPRMSRSTVAFRRLVNPLASWLPDKLWQEVIHLINRETSRLAKRPREGQLFMDQNLLSLQQRREFMGRFQHGNKHIARRLLGRSNGRLFHDPL